MDDFELDNVYHALDGGDVHYSALFPASYDGTRPHALFVTLPGWEGLYFHGVGENLRQERFAQEALRYVDDMVVIAPQLKDWERTSADRTIALVTHFLNTYAIDERRVYIEGYSGGGETLSLVVGARPELFAAALAVSSQWDDDLHVLADVRMPLYLFTGKRDSYYGSVSFVEAADELRELYRQEGFSNEEIDRLITLDLRDNAWFESRGISNQHFGGLQAAFEPDVMGWLFSHRQD